MRERLAALMAGLTTALVMVVVSVVPAGAAVSGPAPQQNGIPADWRPHPLLRFLGSPPQSWTVRSGDTLSAIAAKTRGGARYWPVLWWENRKLIPDPDLIRAGQVLTITPLAMTAAIGTAAMSALPRPVVQAAAEVRPAAPVSDSAPASSPVSNSAPQTGSWPGGAFGICVVMRESGGNPGAWNASGHWGLYQFAASTWAAYGGNPADFGSAGISEQEQVFMNALARGGQGNWRPYDGC